MGSGAERDGTAAEPARTAPPTLLYLMKQVELSVRAALDDLARPEGLTALQYTALTVLERHPDLTAAHLARLSFVTAQSTADMVSTLLDRGLIERHRDPRDRRRLVMALTRRGELVLDRIRPHVTALEERMLGQASAAEATALRHTLEQCRRALHEDPPADQPSAVQPKN